MFSRNVVQLTFLVFAAMVFTFIIPYSTAQAADAYIRYDIKADKADPGYPKPINKRTWPGVWTNGVDAATNWGKGKVYFFPLLK